jgi:hypothetical protein
VVDHAAAFAARIAALPAVLVEATPRAVRASGDVLATRVRSNIAQATGGDSRLSRVRSGRGAAIAVDVDVVGAGSRASARVTPTGPIMLVEEDTSPHRSPFTYRGAGYSMANRRRAGRRGFLFIPGIGFRAAARHPGTKGKHPTREAFTQAGDDAGRAGSLEFTRAVARHFT